MYTVRQKAYLTLRKVWGLINSLTLLWSGVACKRESSTQEMHTEALRILEGIIPRCKHEYSPKLSDIQYAYCYRQLVFIHRIAVDTFALLPKNGGYAGGILCRSLLESLFKLGGAAGSKEMCLRIIYTDASEDLQRMKKFRDVDPNPPPKAKDAIEGLEKKVADLQALSKDPIKRIKLFDATPIGGLQNLYRGSYHPLSQITHGNYSIIDLCAKGKRLVSADPSSATLFVCLAARIASLHFELDDADKIWVKLQSCHPDLRQN